jgi:hypothetical protein
MVAATGSGGADPAVCPAEDETATARKTRITDDITVN